MLALSPRTRRAVRVIAGLGIFCALSAPLHSAFGQPAGPTSQPPGRVARVDVRITSAPTAPTVSGVLIAFDASGQAMTNLEPGALQTTLDGRPVSLSLLTGRPSIALASAFLLDSSASPQVRDALANALAEGVQGLDVNRDTVAIVNTADTRPWEQARFSTSADDLRTALNQVIHEPAPGPEIGGVCLCPGSQRAMQSM